MSIGQRTEAPAALVTGATGFVGSCVARRLAANGWKVHVLARTGSRLALLEEVLDSVTFWRYDGTMESMFTVIQGCSPDVVLHIAAFASSSYRPADISPMLQSNIVFGTQLVEAMTLSGCFRLINTGTFSQHYGNEDYCPKSLYDASKQAFLDILAYYLESTPLKVITLELFDNYGRGDPRPKIMNLLLRAARDQTQLAMTPGEQRIDLVHIEDVAESYLLAAERLLKMSVMKDETYSVSSGRLIRMKDLVRAIERTTGQTLQIDWGGRPYHPREIMKPWDRGTLLPGWRARISLEEGIKSLWEVENI
jgi:nucleoside-diphosphate-sugar epimerase